MIFNTIIYNNADNEKWITINPIVNKDKYSFKYQGCVSLNHPQPQQVKKILKDELLGMIEKNSTREGILDYQHFKYRKANVKEYLTLSNILRISEIKFNKKTNGIIYNNRCKN